MTTSRPASLTTLPDVLRWRARHQPDRHAYAFLGAEAGRETLDYAEVARRARAVARHLADRFAPGERALLLCPPGLGYLAGLFGCWGAGLIAVPAYPPDGERAARRLAAVARDARASVLVTTNLAAAPEQPVPGTALVLVDDILAADAAADIATGEGDVPEPSGRDGDTVALLQYTSGSTSDPRGVVLTHGNLMANLAHIERCFGHTPASRGVSWLPPYHDMGLIGGLLQPLYGGFPITLMAPRTFVRDPLSWLRAISEDRATSSGGPDFAYDLATRRVTPEQRDELDLSAWSVAFSGAEPVRAATMRRFAEYFAPCGFRAEAFYPCYGLAEATLIVSGGDPSAPPVTASVDRARLERGRVVPAPDGYTVVGCGTSVAGQSLRVVDPETSREAPSGTVGEVWVSGASVARGYWNRPEDTARTFSARVEPTGEGPFLRTGDLGFLGENGELFVTGRLKDLIIIRGRSCHPEDIEFTAAGAHPAVRPAACAAFPVTEGDEERLVIVQEVEGRHAGDADLAGVARAVRERVAADHALQAHAVVLVRPAGVPRTTSGKVRRRLCRERLLGGELPVLLWDERAADVPAVPAVSRGELLAAGEERRAELATRYVHALAARLLRVDPAALRPDRPLTEHGMDSVAGLELAHQIERDTGVVLPPSAVPRGDGITALTGLVLAALTGEPGDEGTGPGTGHRDEADAYPLSPGQRAMWTLHQMAGGDGTYNAATALRIEAEVDPDALRVAFGRLVERHAVLRTTYSTVGGSPVQVRHDAVDDWFRHETGVEADALEDRLAEEAARGFDLDWDPVVRVRLFTLAPGEHVLLLVAHHIAVDFWSFELLLRELGEGYEEVRSETPGTRPAALAAPDVLDHVDEQARLLAGPAGERMWEYWRARLAGPLPVLGLPTDRPRPAVRQHRGAAHQAVLGPATAARVARLAAAEGTTPFTVLLAAYQVLLHRYSADEDILVGVPMAGRGRAAFSGLVGYVSNTVPVRARFAGRPAFTEVVRRVRDEVLGAAEHQEYPFSLMVERLGVPRDASQSPVFQTTFTYHAAPAGGGLGAMALGMPGVRGRLGGLPVTSVGVERRVTQFDLALAVAETDDGLACQWSWSTALFDEATVARLAEHFEILLGEVTAAPDRPVAGLPLRTADEERSLAPRPAPVPVPGLTVHEMIAAQAARAPAAVAVTDGQTTLSYRELDERVTRLAARFRALGARPESVVALLLPPGIDYVVALLAAGRAGAAYLPLDPAYPVARLEFMLRDAAVALVVTDGAKVPGLAGEVAVCGPSDGDGGGPPPPVLTGHGPAPGALACVLYTSGTTGRPKGVQVTQAGLMAQVRTLQAEFGLRPGDRQLVVQSFAFAASMRQLFVPLCHGATVVLAPAEYIADVPALFDFARRQGATVMSANPSYWQHCADALEEERAAGRLETFRLLMAASEPMPSGLPERWLGRLPTGASFLNMLGHTELSGIATAYPVPAGEAGDGNGAAETGRTTLVGRPLAGTRVHVLGRDLAPVPFGVPGELYLSGPSLSRGYRNRPGLTAERFVPDPFAAEPGARMYRTGDVVRHRAGGDLEHLGRADDQIKVRGFRIEPGEIEAELERHDAVVAAAVVGRADATGAARVVAYVVPAAGAEPTATALRSHLRSRLPEHLVPSLFVTLAALPRNPNGKVDRRALPEPAAERPRLEGDFVSPGTRIETRLADIWGEVLGVERVGLHDNFFDLGGTSLTLLRAHQLICAEFGVTLPVTTLFQKPTLHDLAAHLAEGDDGPSAQVERSRAGAARRRQLTDAVRARRRGGRS
ncbi:non-ribosomal peptide synthetase [Streptomyces sp. SBT349]|uniref:non-ribosomal peptide synthetase n=1 Tax=Streptomyces sp. SBT349 TaxID=1580539 RepID=UPI00066E1088|nr:non-ribosomal peptide synthetase [Streptomyces sp. SBT349]